ncbi:MAG: hypothetical protein R2838_07715 [Caldilineaceae bacterium]
MARSVYNVTSFSLSAEIREMVVHFPDAVITFAPDDKRAAIVDELARGPGRQRPRRDWGWHPQYDAEVRFGIGAEYSGEVWEGQGRSKD